MVGARPDRADDLLGLGCCEDELDVLRRLLNDLEQRVESLWRHHVRLVEDEDLVAIACGRVDGPLSEVARIIHTVVGGGIDFDDIQRSPAVSREFDAARTLAAGCVGGAFRAVQAAGEDAGRRGLAASARPAEEVGVVHAVGAKRGSQRIGHLRLADQLGERLRTIPAIQGCGHGLQRTGHHRHSRSWCTRSGRRPRYLPMNHLRTTQQPPRGVNLVPETLPETRFTPLTRRMGWSSGGGQETRMTPRAPARARLPLLRFRPGGVGLDGATRGATTSVRETRRQNHPLV